ncbi:MAG TPA: response regulator [Gemmataceae bacterium]|nr:response regulator [Gemmataceae bacterium]
MKKARPSGRPMRILLVDDNPGDVRLTLEAFRDGLPNELSVTKNGVEALAFLRRQGKYTSAPRPDLILLDLNLPLKDGREVLAEIKQDLDMRRIPVVVLTSSRAEDDIRKAYELHANCYICKPVELERFMAVVRSIQDFWFVTVKLAPS